MSRILEYKANMPLGDVLKKLNRQERDNVRELVGKYGWNVRTALQQVFIFGIQRNWVYDYRNDMLVEEI